MDSLQRKAPDRGGLPRTPWAPGLRPEGIIANKENTGRSCADPDARATVLHYYYDDDDNDDD